jgi:hypothetical protein
MCRDGTETDIQLRSRGVFPCTVVAASNGFVRQNELHAWRMGQAGNEKIRSVYRDYSLSDKVYSHRIEGPLPVTWNLRRYLKKTNIEEAGHNHFVARVSSLAAPRRICHSSHTCPFRGLDLVVCSQSVENQDLFRGKRRSPHLFRIHSKEHHTRPILSHNPCRQGELVLLKCCLDLDLERTGENASVWMPRRPRKLKP